MSQNRGFSLLELMIAVAIVGIIASIAYPSYMDSVAKSRRADAQGVLMSFAGAMERHYTVYSTYCGAAASNANASPVAGCTGGPGLDIGEPGIFPTEAPLDGNDKYYDLKIAAASSSGFSITATAKGAQLSDSCRKLALSHTGERKAYNSSNTDITDTGDCWP